MVNWNVLNSLDQLDEIQKDSFTSPQAIFKHSTTCSISHMAKSRLEGDWNLEHVSAHYLDLKVHREISAAIADKWNVHHESPQIIIVKNGEAIFDESHLDITVKDIVSSVS